MKSCTIQANRLAAAFNALVAPASALFIGLMTGCSTYNPVVVGSDAGPYEATIILPGDTIAVSFPGATNLNATITVPVDGEVRLPAAFGNPVSAMWKSRSQFEADLLKEFGPQLRTPEVNVRTVQSAAVVYVSGAVAAPNKVLMNRPMTLLDAVMEAGGPTPLAKMDRVSVVRNFMGEQRTYNVDLSSAFSGQDVMPFYLRPFDSVVVPARKFNF
ncbi:MAG TPA: hypothetical protein DCY13_24145 [Verrucomicrobiales bacterium]|nr:hypothetical protein [Verrucomicrobiales bacterium]